MKIKNKNIERGFEPDNNLLKEYAFHFMLPEENLRVVLLAFGAMPKKGQRKLLHTLFLISNYYKEQVMTREAITLSQKRKRLDEIQKTSRKLLLLCGIDVRGRKVKGQSVMTEWPDTMWDIRNDTTAWHQLKLFQPDAVAQTALMDIAASQAMILDANGNNSADAINKRLGEGGTEVAETIFAVRKLYVRAAMAAKNIKTDGKRGGARNPPKPKGYLIREAIKIYACMRKKYPNSGSKPAFGGAMNKFIQSVGKLNGLPISAAAIKEVWDERRSFLKKF